MKKCKHDYEEHNTDTVWIPENETIIHRYLCKKCFDYYDEKCEECTKEYIQKLKDDEEF